MYANRIDNTDNPIPEYYESINVFEIVFCPYCGAMNYIKLSIRGLIFCDRCGGELQTL